jgi:hypothetical protein
MVVPYPGIGRMQFLGWKMLKFFVFTFLAGIDGGLISIPLSLILTVILASFRSINIGHNPWMGLLGLIPGSIFYFGLRRAVSVRLNHGSNPNE